LEREILNETRERMVKSFLDVVALMELRTGSMSDYDVVTFIHKKW